MADIRMVIRQFTHLIDNCFGNFQTPIADFDTVKPGESIQQMIAIPILNKHPLCRFDNPARAVATGMLGKMICGWKKSGDPTDPVDLSLAF